MSAARQCATPSNQGRASSALVSSFRQVPACHRTHKCPLSANGRTFDAALAHSAASVPLCVQPSRSDFDERIDHEAQRVWQPHSHSPFRANAQRSPLRMHADDAARTQTRRSQPNFAPNTHVHPNDGRKAACQAHHQSLCGYY
eukprot:6181143-Pleurochrysis_carterae.AAC.2